MELDEHSGLLYRLASGSFVRFFDSFRDKAGERRKKKLWGVESQESKYTMNDLFFLNN